LFLSFLVIIINLPGLSLVTDYSHLTAWMTVVKWSLWSRVHVCPRTTGMFSMVCLTVSPHV